MTEAHDHSTPKPSILLVDDDERLRSRMARAFIERGYETQQADGYERAVAIAERESTEYAVIDLRMPGKSGLELVRELHRIDAATKIVVLTGYASVATAVEAIKLGAVHDLTKPADADEILAALHKDEGDASILVSDNPLTVKRLEWEHLHKVLSECDGNISAAARKLRMHRRTLQRKLAKRPVKD